MNQNIGRPILAKVYAGIVSLTTLCVVFQAVLFGGFYQDLSPDSIWIELHGIVGSVSALIVIILLTPLSYLARFPASSRITMLTFGLAVIWVLTYGMGRESDQERSLVMIHMPLAVVAFGLAGHLTARSILSIKRQQPNSSQTGGVEVDRKDE